MDLKSIYICSYLGETDYEFLKKARKLGFTTVFTTLHKSETKQPKQEIINWIKSITSLGFEMVADISRGTLDIITFDDFKKLGIKTLRIDDGFTPSEILKIQKDKFNTILNASNITQEQLDEFNKAKLSKENTLFFHNFYPKPETGLSRDFCALKSNLIYKNGYKLVGGFISSSLQKRGPMFLGLPTMEETRYLDEYNAYLIAKNYFDIIAVGDQTANLEILKKIANIPEKNKWDLEVEFVDKTFEKRYAPQICNKYYTIRPDLGFKMLRLYESRVNFVTDDLCEQGITATKKRGELTIDNKNYAKYKAELNIWVTPGKPNSGTDIIGRIKNIDVLDLIKGGDKIRMIVK